jgi:hypothetical protein
MAPSKPPPGLGKDMYQPKNIQHNAGVVNFMCAGLIMDITLSLNHICPCACMDAMC